MRKKLEIDFTSSISAEKKKAPLNKPFRLPKGNKKKFGVYVKNDKGNVVMVKFGDPNMSIKRDNPARRKAFRSRHSCDDNPGPKWKARYWSCRMWEAKKSVTDYTKGSDEFAIDIDVQAKSKGLWYNIQQKKKRMGKNYRPAPVGSKDRPSQEALKKAQGSDYENESYEWDGETEFDQLQLLKLDQTLAQAEEAEDVEDEFEDYKEEEENQECEDMEESEASCMFKVGDKVRNVNASCKHYGSEGVVKEIRTLPEDMGYAVVYECTNQGMTWKKGDLLGKTEIQLKKIN